MVNQMECGARPVSDDFVSAVAHVLNIDVTTLTGQNSMPDHRLDGLVAPILVACDHAWGTE